jgi:hypothetical protein
MVTIAVQLSAAPCGQTLSACKPRDEYQQAGTKETRNEVAEPATGHFKMKLRQNRSRHNRADDTEHDMP